MRLTAATRVVQLALLVALSVLGAYVRVGAWSIAFDSMAGFVAALLLGPGAGALVCGLGHLAAATATGFPLSLPLHLAIAVVMAVVGGAGGVVAQRAGLIAGTVTLVLANGLIAPALLALLPNPMGLGLFAAMALPLTVGAGANALIALVVAGRLRRAVYGA